jgi:tRNA(Ile)-lysidine synthase TilS/MesJ
MRAAPIQRQRQGIFQWEEKDLCESVPHERREQCRHLLAKLLNQVAMAEGCEQEGRARRDSNER